MAQKLGHDSNFHGYTSYLIKEYGRLHSILHTFLMLKHNKVALQVRDTIKVPLQNFSSVQFIQFNGFNVNIQLIFIIKTGKYT